MTTTIVVAGNDTLWRLAARHLGSPFQWPILYEANAKEIQAQQERRGLFPASPEDLIFPGTRLVIP